MNFKRIALVGGVGLMVAACGSSGPVTYGEASEALTESANEAQAMGLASNTIELSTNFTIGMGVMQAAQELRNFIEQELPCATVTLQAPTVTVEYGTHGTCTYRGQVITGKHTVTVMRDDDSVEVHHTWTDLTNTKVKVNGSATVTWSRTDKSRHVQYELTFVRLSDNVSATGSGDIVQKVLDDTMPLRSADNGLQLDGTRTWTGPKGKWTLTIEGVKLRWRDPLPYTGSYTLETPAGKEIVLSFERLDDSTIQATLEGGRKTYYFKVHQAGNIESSSS